MQDEDLSFGNRPWMTTSRRERVREYLATHGTPDLKAKRQLMASIGGSMFSIRNNILLIAAEKDPDALRLVIRNKFRANQMRVRKYAVADTMSESELLSLFVRESGQCAMCREKFPVGDVCFDHKIPMGYGGPNSIENIQLLCLPCHGKKVKEDRQWKKSLTQAVIDRMNSC